MSVFGMRFASRFLGHRGKIVGADFGIWDGCGVRVGLLFPVWLGLVFLDWIPLGCLDLLVLGFVIGELVLGRFGSVLACLLHV